MSGFISNRGLKLATYFFRGKLHFHHPVKPPNHNQDYQDHPSGGAGGPGGGSGGPGGGSGGPGGDSGVPGGCSGGPGGHWASSGTHPSGPYSAVVDIGTL